MDPAAYGIKALSQRLISMAYGLEKALSNIVSMYMVQRSMPKLGSIISSPSAIFWNGTGVLFAQGFMMVQPGPEICPGMMIVAGKPSLRYISFRYSSEANLFLP